MFGARENLCMRGWCTELEVELNLSLIPRPSPEGPGMSSQQMRRESFTSWKFTLSIPKAQSVQFSSVAQSCPTLCDPMIRSTPGLPVHHHLLEFTRTHVHWVCDAIQPSHPWSSPSPPAPNPSQHQSLFQWVNSWGSVYTHRERSQRNKQEHLWLIQPLIPDFSVVFFVKGVSWVQKCLTLAVDGEESVKDLIWQRTDEDLGLGALVD